MRLSEDSEQLKASNSDHRPVRHYAFPALAILVAGLMFGFSAFWQSPRLFDFAITYASARAWVAGENPYDTDRVRARWEADKPSGLLPGNVRTQIPLFPPPTLALMAPLTFLSPNVAAWAWWAFTLALIAAEWFALVRLAGWKPGAPRALLLAAGMLALCPMQVGVRFGQPAIPAISAVVLAIYFCECGRTLAAAILLAIATSLKPQIGGPFILYFLVRGHLRASIYAMVLSAVVAAVALWRLQWSHVAWWKAYGEGLHVPQVDFTPDNAFLEHLINLQVPVYAVFANRVAANVVALAIPTLLILWYARRARDRRGLAQLGPLSVLSVVLLMPIYHRYYDAALLVVPMTLAIALIGKGRGKAAILMLGLISFFVLPINFFSSLVARGLVTADAQASALWRVAVLPSRGWVMLAIAMVCVYLATRENEPQVSTRGVGSGARGLRTLEPI